MRKIVSYSYFRNANSSYEKEKGDSALQFQQFMPLLVRAHHVIWPGWELHIAHDTQVQRLPYFASLTRMWNAGLLALRDFGVSTTLCGRGGMMERMRPVFDVDDGVVLCRDIDTIPTIRDRRAVEEFEDSGHIVHVIHDAGPHSGIMGGTLGVKAAAFRDAVGCRSLGELLSRSKSLDWNRHGDDQHFLNAYVLPLVAHKTLVHDLHHTHKDMPGTEVRLSLTRHGPGGMMFRSAGDVVRSEELCPGIGMCDDPAPALEFYDSLDLPVIETIRRCER